MKINSIILLLLSLTLTSCLNSPRFQSSRINSGKQLRANSSYINVKGKEPVTVSKYTTTNYDVDPSQEDTTYYENDSFEYMSYNFAPTISKTFESDFIFNKYQISGILLPFFFMNYGELFFKFELVDIGENGLFSNLSVAPFIGGNFFFIIMGDIYYESTAGFSAGTFSRKNMHEIEIATNIIFNNSKYESHNYLDERYRSLLFGLGSTYTYWKEEKDKFFSIELGLFYNYTLSRSDTYSEQYTEIPYTVDRNEMAIEGFPFSLSLSVVNSF